MDLAPQNLQETVTITLEDDSESFMMYWVSCLAYSATIYIMMNLAYSVELSPYFSPSADGERTTKDGLMFGLTYVILPTLGPVITWSLLSYVFGFLFNFLMGFWGGWSLFGVYFLNLIFSYSDDILMTLLISLIDSSLYIVPWESSASTFDNVYIAMPTYLLSFVVKTCANIGMLL